MKVYGISNPNQQISSKGKFIIPENFTDAEKQAVNKVINSVVNNKTSVRILKRKPYDVWLERSEKYSDKLIFKSSYRELYTDKPTECYISTMGIGDEYITSSVNGLRGGLEWFDWYKKEHLGFNNFFEKLAAIIKDPF